MEVNSIAPMGDEEDPKAVNIRALHAAISGMQEEQALTTDASSQVSYSIKEQGYTLQAIPAGAYTTVGYEGAESGNSAMISGAGTGCKITASKSGLMSITGTIVLMASIRAVILVRNITEDYRAAASAILTESVHSFASQTAVASGDELEIIIRNMSGSATSVNGGSAPHGFATLSAVIH